MNAATVAVQSFYFYKQLFSKLILLGIGSALLPLLFGINENVEEFAVGPALLFIIAKLFFIVFTMVFIHQYAEKSDSNLVNSLPLALDKLFPVAMTNLTIGMLSLVPIVPSFVVMLTLTANIQQPQLKTAGMLLAIVIPMLFVTYRCFAAPYLTMIENTPAVEAIKRSNTMVKAEPLIFKCFALLLAIGLGYFILLYGVTVVFESQPMILTGISITMDALMMPLFYVYIYRVFSIVRQSLK